MRILKLGSVGQEVKQLQDVLNTIRATQPPLQSDGIFGPKTQAAVRAFKQRVGLTTDGIVGPVTSDALLKATYSIVLRR
jgi:peptidoglycan hydrolase-like protein with peptidoglycan-binding domain